ncbi:MAG: N-acetylmuramoyl-L-alanine amidase [Thalassobaculum sp.]|uniref:N-acetylmuramoyl-L-alanine amidase n=1 Tax=Thalassobaculum sp. TaxID=2022740 RepID=UPI0032F0784E
MTGGLRPLALAGALALSACAAPPGTCAPPRIVVDIGHTPDAPGTVSAAGVPELTFNRSFAERLTTALRRRLPADGTVRTVSIGDPDQKLDRRVAAIAAQRPSLILSIHHDSVQERYLTRRTVDGMELTQTDAAAGFSLFVPADTPVAAGSLAAAQAVADALAVAGERPSLHHAEPIPGENRRLLDPARGIYAGDFLKILRTATAPAVLVEVGVIKNPVEEHRLSDPATADRMADALARATASACF